MNLKMKLILQVFSMLLIVVVLLLNSNDVMANECVPCTNIPLGEDFICGVDDKGVAKRFSSECALRFENCDKKTKFERTDKSLCE